MTETVGILEDGVAGLDVSETTFETLLDVHKVSWEAIEGTSERTKEVHEKSIDGYINALDRAAETVVETHEGVEESAVGIVERVENKLGDVISTEGNTDTDLVE
jgi:hypothetical protein